MTPLSDSPTYSKNRGVERDNPPLALSQTVQAVPMQSSSILEKALLAQAGDSVTISDTHAEEPSSTYSEKLPQHPTPGGAMFLLKKKSRKSSLGLLWTTEPVGSVKDFLRPILSWEYCNR